MIQLVDVDSALTLDDFGAVAHLSGAVGELRAEAAQLAPALQGRTVWMVNSTAQGGGVAEMLPRMVAILRELGVDCRWAVIGTDREAFFPLTKRIHNMVHGMGEPGFSEEERALYRRVSEENADDLGRRLGPDDVLVVHDPQPLGMGTLLKERHGVNAIWRCHIGLEDRTPVTESVWDFLQPWADAYDQAVFSTPEYIPPFLAGRARVIYPAIDPLGHKNRELSVHKIMGVIVDSGLGIAHAPVVTPAFEHQAQRLMPDGRWRPACELEELGLMFRPTIVQISRWDRLKGFGPLLQAFVQLKARAAQETRPRHKRRLEIMRLILAGPDPASVSDDPEGLEVLRELEQAYLALSPELQRDVALLTLPMASRKENALMVNVLQRCASVVVQNSLREGFGLTATEAMWKRVPVVASRAGGLRHQIRDGIDGRLIDDPSDPAEVAAVLDALMEDAPERELMARSAQRRAHDNFLVFGQMRHWLELLSTSVTHRPVVSA